MEQQGNEVEGREVAAARDISDTVRTVAEGEMKSQEDDKDSCRICRGDASPEQPLFYPCKCSGSIKYVHQDCLMEWLSHSQKKYCELCKTPFRFTKLYDQSMPQTLPLPLFLRQVVIHTSRASFRWIRYTLVAFVWAGWLPWFIRLLWRALFWLADGSWVSQKGLHDTVLDAPSLLSEAGNSTAAPISAVLSQVNSTFSDLSAVLGTAAPKPVDSNVFTFRQSLPYKILENLYPNLAGWVYELVSMNAEDRPLILLTPERQPSLLSNVNFIRNLTSHAVLNNTVIDVVEGQLICLSIITAFILVFLIREWVINQQPIANMPDPDRVDDAAPAEPRNAAQRRRRRNAIHGNAADAAHVQQANGPRVIAVPRRQRRLRNGEVVQRAVDAQIDEVDEGTDDASVTDADRQGPEHDLEGRETAEIAPPLLVRGALDPAASIQRDLEESARNTTPDEPPSPICNPEPGEEGLANSLHCLSQYPLAEQKRLLGDALYPKVLRELPELASKITRMLLEMDNAEVVMLLQDDTALRAQIDRAHHVYDEYLRGRSPSPSFGSDGPSTPFLAVQAEYKAGEADDQDEEGDAWEDEPEEAIPTPTSTSDQVTDSSVDGTTPESVAYELVHGRLNPRAVQTQGILEQVFAWMWHIDDAAPNLPEPIDEDAEYIVQDPAAEAPFVPIRPQATLANAADPNDAPEPVAHEPAQPNMFLGVDLNDPDAIDDAEDIEGILDLIGMQGPIGNMVLNVMFCVFLITLTIAASVWLPYIWGKIALLILANPVGFFVKAPLHLASKSADIAIDLICFTFALLAMIGTNILKAVQGPLSEVAPRLAARFDLGPFLDSVSKLAQTHGRQLENSLVATVVSIRPDLSTFSTQSHHALRLVEKQITTAFGMVSLVVRKFLLDLPSQMQHAPWRTALGVTKADVYLAFLQTYHMLQSLASNPGKTLSELGSASIRAHREVVASIHTTDDDVVRWTTRDRILAVVLGYLFFALVGYLYLKIERLVLGAKADEHANGVIGDGLRQAGGVLKVVVIIGIEMIVFPLYCGFLLDIALLPLFHGATVQSRAAFMMRAPITGIFVHWFIGTCYMFHFALFVSMCRKILRKGVLYFIRDPDDPTFHPVRDVLERPVGTQLGKIAFSAVIYGGLVILCLGGVIYTLSGMDGVFPIHWSTNEPRLAFPVDVVFYNFMLPFIIRKAEPSAKISAMYAWWFRGCAQGLRLTNFLFGEDREEEKGTHVRQSWMAKIQLKQGDISQPVIGEDRRILVEDRQIDAYFFRDGTYVRVPASDSVRIPKGDQVFLEVNENNERVDGRADHDKGIHGKKDERFTKVYLPPNFKARIATFILLIWIFASITGVALTIGPLVLGRRVLKYLAQSELPPNDLYSFTIGIHITVGLAYIASKRRVVRGFFQSNAGEYLHAARRMMPQAYSTAKYTAGMIYMGIFFGTIFPFLLSMLAELYLHVPLYTYLVSTMGKTAEPDSTPSLFNTDPFPATVFVLQTWTLGLLYMRIVLRAIAGPSDHPHPTRPARAIRAISRHGLFRPDVALATRAVIIPALAMCAFLFLTPIALGRILTIQVTDADLMAKVYRYSYPGLLAAVMAAYCAVLLRRQVSSWRMRIRDEVYLIGERLHNFQEGARSTDVSLVGRARRGERVEILG